MANIGSKISASDYNELQSKVATVMGVGSGTYGYGQTSPQYTSSQVVGNSKIAVTQWINLRSDLVNAYAHQGNLGNLTIPNIPTTTTKVTAADYNLYAALATSIYNNASVTPPSSQASLTSFSSGQRTTAWNNTIHHNVTLTFDNANAARYYFNSGGNFQFSASLINYPGYPGYGSADASYVKDGDWNMLLSNMGTITFNSSGTTSTGSYDYIGTSIGFYQLTSTPTRIFQKKTSNPHYTNNEYSILASISGAVLTFDIQFADLSGGGTDENVEGTLTSQIQAYYATGANVQVRLPTYNATMTGGALVTPPPPPPYVAPPPPYVAPPPPYVAPPPPYVAPPPPYVAPPPPYVAPPPPYVAPPPFPPPSYGSFVFSPAGPVVAGTSVTCSATVSNAVGLAYSLLVIDGLGNTLVQLAGQITANPQTIQGIFTATYAGYADGLHTRAFFGVGSLNTEQAPSLTVTAAPPPPPPSTSFGSLTASTTSPADGSSVTLTAVVNYPQSQAYALLVNDKNGTRALTVSDNLNSSGSSQTISGSFTANFSGSPYSSGFTASGVGSYRGPIISVVAPPPPYIAPPPYVAPPPYYAPPTVSLSGSWVGTPAVYGVGGFYDVAVTSANASSGGWADSAGHSGSVNFNGGNSTGFNFTVSGSQAAGNYTIVVTMNGPGGSATANISYTIAAAPTYNETVSGPSQVTVGESFTVNLSGGTPNTGVTWSGAASGSASLDGSGNGVFNSVSFGSAGTYNYTFTFNATGHTRSYSVTALDVKPTLVINFASNGAIDSASGGTVTVYYQTTGNPVGGYYYCVGSSGTIVGSSFFAPGNPSGSLSVSVPAGQAPGSYTLGLLTYNTSVQAVEADYTFDVI